MLTLNGALVLGLGVLPGGLMTLCQHAIIKALSNT
jgi:NADH-quinone oxidoreductase subunit N